VALLLTPGLVSFEMDGVLLLLLLTILSASFEGEIFPVFRVH